MLTTSMRYNFITSILPMRNGESENLSNLLRVTQLAAKDLRAEMVLKLLRDIIPTVFIFL